MICRIFGMDPHDQDFWCLYEQIIAEEEGLA